MSMAPFIFTVVRVLAVVCALSACTLRRADPAGADAAYDAHSPPPREYLIGEYGSMSGGEATFGTTTHEGIVLAVEEADAHGGVHGKPLRLVTYDDQSLPDMAVAVVKRLISQDRVLALLGEVASSRTLAAAPIAQVNQIPMITPSSTNPRITEIGDEIFRVCFTDTFQGTAMAKFAFSTLHFQRVAVLRDLRSDYSMGLSQYFKKTFTALGGQIVAEQTYQAGDRDFKAQLTQIRSTKPQGLFIPGYYSEVGLIAQQARQMGVQAVLLGGDGWSSPKLHELGQDAVNGSFFSNHFASTNKDKRSLEFVARFQKRWGHSPDGLAAVAYDAANVLISAMSRASVVTPRRIRDEIATTKNFAGVTGNITINNERNAVKSLVVVKVNGESEDFVETVNP